MRYKIEYDSQPDPMSNWTNCYFRVWDKQTKETIFEERINSLNEATALPELISMLNDRLNPRKSEREELASAVKRYMWAMFHSDYTDEVARMVAGVLAFIHVEYQKEPFYPVTIDMVEDKKWWEFWK